MYISVTFGAGRGNPFDFAQGKLLIQLYTLFRQAHANGEPAEPERVEGIEPSSKACLPACLA